MSERVTIEAGAPSWAHAMALALNKIIATQAKRIRELEARVKTLEGA
jgi:hypothetical protein